MSAGRRRAGVSRPGPDAEPEPARFLSATTGRTLRCTMNAERFTAPARRIHGMLLAVGPQQCASVLEMLRVLGFWESEAAQVVAHGIRGGLFEVDPADPTLLRALRPRDAARPS